MKNLELFVADKITSDSFWGVKGNVPFDCTANSRSQLGNSIQSSASSFWSATYQKKCK